MSMDGRSEAEQMKAEAERLAAATSRALAWGGILMAVAAVIGAAQGLVVSPLILLGCGAVMVWSSCSLIGWREVLGLSPRRRRNR